MNRILTVGSHGLEYAALSDVGLVRAKNQDCLVVAVAGSEKAWRERGHLFVVADGMGAHAAGELASKIAVDTVPLSYQKQQRRSPPDALARAMQDANTRIHHRGQANEEFRGMGTTLSTMVWVPQGAIVAHAGDSRVYRLRNETLEQLTFDHSLVWEVCEAEGISEEEVPAYIPRNVITRSVGSRPEIQIDLEGPYPLEVGDTFLLCSDGLSGLVKNREIGTILGCMSPREATRALVDLAISRGGPDNVTAVVARFLKPRDGGQLDERPAGPGESPRGKSGVWVWPVIIGLLVSVAGWFVGGTIPAAAGGIAGALIAAAGIAAARWFAGSPRHHLPHNQPLGKGPYRRTDCPINEVAAELIASDAASLRAVAENEKWEIDWQEVEAFSDRAVAASRSNDFGQAIREHCGAISYLVGKFRAGLDQAVTEESAIDFGDLPT